MLAEKYDCEPTLTDQQVIEFCKNGILMLEAVVPDDINRRTIEFIDRHPDLHVDRSQTGKREVIAPIEILQEEWFVNNVIKNLQAAGAVRSLLGKDLDRKSTRLNSSHW